ncbi:hypothetical protein LOTGIDRAFT_164313 [Lottia gigantea]|uniref:Uncharacterized protein n=1 Tax=Lottia gigantea TaxID=225164 RepID=V4A169_LOTGI|nr:hypothetical protein LOTGIDRAFT_164313 [Lottia gigantea]ESO90387.1 hypothetical protein LOTGIDRAFT_164313 [Lottia gigantea]
MSDSFSFPDKCSGSCAHTCTFDGRKYETLGGLTSSISCVVDDNLICDSADKNHHHQNTLVHEFGHLVMHYMPSHLRSQGEDLAFLCTTGPDNVEVQYTYNPDVWNVRQYTQNFTNVETKKEDGRLFCRFTQSSLPRFDDNGAVNFNLTEKWYLFLAYGGTLPRSLIDYITLHPNLFYYLLILT